LEAIEINDERSFSKMMNVYLVIIKIFVKLKIYKKIKMKDSLLE